jgi:hypothetical protein
LLLNQSSKYTDMINTIKNRQLPNLILSLVIILLAVSCKPAQKAPAAKARAFHTNQAEAIQADSLQGYYLFTENKVFVRTLYDADSIMVEVRTSDTISLRSMLVNGMTIWLDPEGKQNRNFRVTYPAARSEMFRTSDEGVSRFETRRLVQRIQERGAVLTDDKGTRFVDNQVARITYDERGNLTYVIRMAFSQLGTSMDALNALSIGVTSDLHQAVMANNQGGGGIATRPNIGERNRPQQQPQQHRPTGPRIMAIPINNWLLVSMRNEPAQPNVAGDKSGDDIYFRNNN